MLQHPSGDVRLIYLYLSGTPALPSFTHFQLINSQGSSHTYPPTPPPLPHAHTTQTFSQPTRLHNLKGDIRNKFDTSAFPRSALRTKRNLILGKPPDRISALALCCQFTAIPSTLTTHTLARFLYLSSSILLIRFLLSHMKQPLFYLVLPHHFFSLPVFLFCLWLHSFSLCRFPLHIAPSLHHISHFWLSLFFLTGLHLSIYPQSCYILYISIFLFLLLVRL